MRLLVETIDKKQNPDDNDICLQTIGILPVWVPIAKSACPCHEGHEAIRDGPHPCPNYSARWEIAEAPGKLHCLPARGNFILKM
jgi:hypothetical protein